MNISVIVPAYNEEKYIGACLESLLAHAPANLLEIIVVNNASSDNTANIAAAFSKVKVVFEARKGLTRARQRGLSSAHGDIVAYVDADAMVSDSWFATINKEFLNDPDLVSLSGPYYYYDLQKWKRQVVKAYWQMIALPSYAITNYMVIGGNFAVKRDVLLKIGGFDTSIEFYGEDTNIARRLAKAGKVKFLKDLYVQTSARRLADEGLFRTGVRYTVNFASEVLFKKPFTKTYKDIR